MQDKYLPSSFEAMPILVPGPWLHDSMDMPCQGIIHGDVALLYTVTGIWYLSGIYDIIGSSFFFYEVVYCTYACAGGDCRYNPCTYIRTYCVCQISRRYSVFSSTCIYFSQERWGLVITLITMLHHKVQGLVRVPMLTVVLYWKEWDLHV